MSDDINLPDQMNARSQAHRCPQCRGEMTYDAGAQSMRCQHCGHAQAVASKYTSGRVVEIELWRGFAQSEQKGFGTPTRTAKCGECGAAVHFDEAKISTRCAFCGSPQVLDRQANRQVIQPESLVPFQIERQIATQKFSHWLRGLWFRPNSLKSDARIAEMTGMYVPYWTFDADVHSDWTAEAGYYYYETETYTETDSQGHEETKTREVRHTRWESASGSRSDKFDDILICASAGLPKELSNKLRTFRTTMLKPYNPQYLVGWSAEEYAIEIQDAWKSAYHVITATQESRCGSDVPGDEHRSLSVTNRLSQESFKHVLLPIWISAYRYNNKVYRFLVNGQTGELIGQAPYSAVKITLFILFWVVLSAALIVFRDALGELMQK